MKVKVTFECEIYPCDRTPWFEVYEALNHSSKFDQLQNVKVFDEETNEEL